MAEHIGERIKQLRHDRMMTGAVLARAVGVSRTSVSHWESGKMRPDAYRLPQIADALGVSVDTLMTGHADGSTVVQIDTSEARRALLDSIIKWAPTGEGAMCESLARAYVLLSGQEVTR